MPAVGESQPRPNVVLIVTDNLGRDLGCYGNPVIRTPNIDRLAGEGVRMTHAFCTTSSCSPSRSVILTGLYAHANGMYGLAHAYHHKVLGHGHPGIAKAFKQAKQAGTYAEVRHISGKTKPHYAMNNDKEYFAESSEAYFGKNDFYPFVRAELKQHDPNMYALLEKLWNPPK